jgi:hypothetical protein
LFSLGDVSVPGGHDPPTTIANLLASPAHAEQVWIKKNAGQTKIKKGQSHGYSPPITSGSCRAMPRAQCIPCCTRKGYGSDCQKVCNR